MCEKDQSLWEFNDVARYENESILIMPNDNNECVTLNINIQRPCIVEACLKWVGSALSDPPEITISLFETEDFGGFGLKLLPSLDEKG